MSTGQYDPRQSPTDSELFELSSRELQLSVRTVLVGKLTEITPASRKAKVELQSLAVETDIDTNRQVIREPIILQNIQVLQPHTGAGYFSLPIQVGDTGIVLVFDRDVSDWLENGLAGRPRTFTLHNQASSVFIPGFLTNSQASANPIDQTAAVVEAEQILLGENAIQPAVKGDDLRAKMNELIGVFNGHTHLYIPPIPQVALAQAPTATPLPQQSTVLPTDFNSTKVSVE